MFLTSGTPLKETAHVSHNAAIVRPGVCQGKRPRIAALSTLGFGPGLRGGNASRAARIMAASEGQVDFLTWERHL